MGGAGKVNLAAGAGLVLASSLTAVAWAARRRRLHAGCCSAATSCCDSPTGTTPRG